MKKTTVLFVVLWACSSWLVAQQRTQKQAAEAAPDTTTCSFSYSSGAGGTSTAYCLSVNGNIVQFASPAGYELIDAGAVYEGYGVCDVNDPDTTNDDVAYFDYARTDSGNWGATVVSAPNATTRKFVRATADGIWQLTQTIKQIKANASSAGSVKVTMALKNLSGVARLARLIRMADVDAGDHLNDHFVADHNAAWGTEFGGFGLMSINNTFSGITHAGFIQTVFAGPDPCNYGVNLGNQPFVGDGSILHLYLTTVNPGATRTVVMTYKPI